MPVCMPVLIERDNNGYLNLKTNTPGATVHYSLNGGEEKIYTEPFEFISGGHVEACLLYTSRRTYLSLPQEILCLTG